jgi:hypothetical protein
MKRPPGNDGGSGKALVPISSNGSGSKVPAPRHRNPFASFQALTDLFDEQVEMFEQQFYGVWRERALRIDLYRQGESLEYVRDLWKETREGAEQCAAEMMHQSWETAIENGEDLHHPSDEYIMLRITSMGLALPEVTVTKDYGTRLAERLGSEEPSMMVCESIFRELEDTWKKKSPPGIPDVLSLLEKYTSQWQRRLAAIDLDKIKYMGETLIFALEFKNAIFKAAVLEYLDNHGHTDLAAGVRAGELDHYLIAIEGTVRTEGDLPELAARMDTDTMPVGDPFEEARQILIGRKHVMLEWDLLLINAKRRLNRDKAFVCSKCGAGYEVHYSRCMICDGAIVDHEVWDKQVACEQQPLEAELQRRQQQLQREQKRREKSVQPRWQEYLVLLSEKVAAREEELAKQREEARVLALFEPALRNIAVERRAKSRF